MGVVVGWMSYIFCCVFLLLDCTVFVHADVQILSFTTEGEIAKSAQISCSVLPANATVVLSRSRGFDQQDVKRLKSDSEVRTLEQKDLDGNKITYTMYNQTILNLTASDSDNYTCTAIFEKDEVVQSSILDLSFPAKLVKKSQGPYKFNATDQSNDTLYCVFEIFNATEIKWLKENKGEETIELASKKPEKLTIKQYGSKLDIHIRRPEDNGTYVCEIYDQVTSKTISGRTDIFVYAAPKIIIDTVKPISSHQIYLNWTIHAYNLPIKGYNLMYRRLPSSDFNLYTKEKIGIKNTTFVMEGLDNTTEYQLKLEVTTSYGTSNPYIYPQIVKTLEKNPVFVPNISINGFSATSVTIGWAPPPEDIAEYIHYYLLEARKKDENSAKKAYHSRDGLNLPYMFDDLEPHSTYVFRVCSCSEFTKQCGNWSEEMEAITLDGVPGRPSNVTLFCHGDASVRYLNLTWDAPVKPNAEIKGYSMELTGNSTYRDRYGLEKMDTWGPLSKFFTNATRSMRFDELKPNTNYTVRLSAMTRTRRRGEEATRYCTTQPAEPDSGPRPRWRKIVEKERYMFKTYIPRISERNGPICCYRVYMIRLLPGLDWRDLPPPKDISIINYEEAHSEVPALGAYITDMFSNNKYPPESELVMGDEGSFIDNSVCQKCQKKPKRNHIVQLKVSTTTEREEEYDLEEDSTMPNVEQGERVRRSQDVKLPTFYLLRDNGEYWNNPVMMDAQTLVQEMYAEVEIKDGPLDPESNYTLFVELLPNIEGVEPLYSDYLNVLMPAPNPPTPSPINVTEVALQVTCGLVGVLLIIMFGVCIMHSRRTRKMPPNAHIEINPISAAFRYVVEQVLSGGRGGGLATPPDLPPIAKDDLASAYAERQADSDYGFQKEFELLQMLPDCLPDRTTLASEARENQSKNRYPDIKAYDQTRVKLQQIDGVIGSDYINANYVMGYKERKQFICAQGPTESTVNDFWRMIYEQRLELVLMLTNLEEYSKVKCARYWPEDVRASKGYGGISVTNHSEKRYSDYIVRELKIVKLNGSEGQPIENNGVKRNGDVNSSTPTSPRDKSTSERTVLQFHFLMWKDFAAPEHAHSILKFIKRMNEANSQLSGRPIVVHCSAGVGRTGTLVALDCLLQQLSSEGKVSVFNTVAELRSQRNFLVQSLKQYVFVYRALVEFAHFGDTEVVASKMKSYFDRLRNTPEGEDHCLMEIEFQKMIVGPVSEPIKSCAAGSAEELRSKNRSQDCLPYDRNRVILAPMPTKEYSTYINASFIEAYDNTEGFIITQDPLPNTISDFWRMVSEHNVTTIVMLSEIGEGDRKCPRYWDDECAQYDHISVQYEESECCPYYTKRRFRVTNNKSGSVSMVVQFQYQGWPTAMGHLPEVTRGLTDLVHAAHSQGVLLAHCHLGTERSPLLVALCILICQLRVERRVDVNCVARKVRSQRANTIDTFSQYEFLHRAILNYAELHNLMDDS